jgi:hypothetical protein
MSWEPVANGFLGAVRLRHLGAHPLDEANSVRGDPTSVVNLSGGYQLGTLRLTASVLNLLDARDADIQYFYASRVGVEPVTGVDAVHFHPIEPRQVRLSVTWGY